MYRLMLIVLVSCLTATQAVSAEGIDVQFERVEAKTFDKEKFLFPEDLRATRLNVVFLAMTKDQDTGEYLQQALIDWQTELEQRNVISDEVMAWHFPVISGLPFFLKGVVTRAMRKDYEGKVPLDQAGILFVDDIDAFAAAAGQVVDDLPAIVLVTPEARPLQVFKGEVTPEGADEVANAIKAWMNDAN